LSTTYVLYNILIQFKLRQYYLNLQNATVKLHVEYVSTSSTPTFSPTLRLTMLQSYCWILKQKKFIAVMKALIEIKNVNNSSTIMSLKPKKENCNDTR
jgi:hypothetical protein